MPLRRFSNGEQILYRRPDGCWEAGWVSGESATGAYVADRHLDDRQIAGVIPDSCDAVALVANLTALTSYAATATNRQSAWDSTWALLESEGIERLPGILPGF